MTTPRIYTYKVTFEEIPDWYWGVHKEKKYGELYLGSSKTHAWKWEFYTPHLQICEIFPYTDEGWAKAREVEDRCILPDLNNPLCLNEHVGGLMSLEANRRGGRKACEIVHAEKDDLGRSVLGVKNAERMNAITHKEKDDLGRSINAVKAATAAHKEKDEMGRSLHTLKLHEEKDELGRSVHGVKCAVASHKEKDELGRSVNAVKGAEQMHKDKDEFGRSVQGVKNAERVHKDKDEFGRSAHAVKMGKAAHKEKDEFGRSVQRVKNAEKTNKQIWESTVDGFRSHSGNVARHNKANGWDPAARIKIS